MGGLSAAKTRGCASDRGRFLRIDDVIATTGLGRTTIYRLVSSGEFPGQVQLTKRCVGWWDADVAQWLDSRRGHDLPA